VNIMRRADWVRDQIRKRWGDGAATSYCELILDFIVSHAAPESEMLTFGLLANITHVDAANTDLHQAVAILASRFAALSSEFVLFTEDGKAHYLTHEEREAFLSEGIVADPATGLLVEDAAERVFPYFVGQRAALLGDVQA
jgi:hypothetical protein